MPSTVSPEESPKSKSGKHSFSANMRAKLNMITPVNLSPGSSMIFSIAQSLEPLLRSIPRILRHVALLLALTLPRFASFKDKISTYSETWKWQIGFRNTLTFIIHKSTTLVVFAAFTIFGGAFATLSTNQSQQQDSGFSAAISQASFSLLSIYLTILPPLRSKSLHLRYPLWFWGCLVLSGLTSILSTAMYFRLAAVATILSCVSSFAQVLCSLLLVECVEEAVKAGNIGGGQFGRI
jgi:hypothetical protein